MWRLQRATWWTNMPGHVVCAQHAQLTMSVLWCSVTQCDAVWCSVMQCDAVCCSVLQSKEQTCWVVWCALNPLAIQILHGCPVFCCSVLQRVAACCSVLQRVAAIKSIAWLSFILTNTPGITFWHKNVCRHHIFWAFHFARPARTTGWRVGWRVCRSPTIVTWLIRMQIQDWVISHIWMSHVTRLHESRMVRMQVAAICSWTISCDMTHSCVTWRIYVGDMTYVYVWHGVYGVRCHVCDVSDSYIYLHCGYTRDVPDWYVHQCRCCVCDMTHPYKHLCCCYMCDVTHSLKKKSVTSARVTWLIYINPCVVAMCVPWLIRINTASLLHAWRDSFRKNESLPYVRRDSFM